MTPSIAGEAGAQVLPHLADVGQDVLAFEDVQGGEGGRGGHRVAAEGGPVLAGGQQRGRFRAEGHEGADREAAAQALGEGHGVGHDPGVLAGSHLPVRPMPVWTSSRISRAPAALVASRAALR